LFKLVLPAETQYDRAMRTITVSSLGFLLWVAAAMASAAAPAISVCVSDSNGKVAFKGVTYVNAPFVTGDLAPGNYVVQFNSTRAALNGHQYLLVVSAGKTKVVANSVAAEQFDQGGVALRVRVGAGSKISGQVALGPGKVSDIAFERMQAWQSRGGEGSLRNHYAGRESLMVGQTGRGY
jgi:hypothetical protein